jgi:DNA-binding HxlR family transcriptional regulator
MKEVISMPIAKLRDSTCSVARSLSVLGERWTLLIVREALSGTTRFDAFRVNLGVAADVLSERLSTLVECGVMHRDAYQVAGRRTQYEYSLTETGQELHVVIGALQQWGDQNLPRPEGPSVSRRSKSSSAPVKVAFVDEAGHVVPNDDVVIIETEAGRLSAE